MFELKQKLSGGNLADFTRYIRKELNVTPGTIVQWNTALGRLPDMEAAGLVIAAARVAGFYPDGQAPTDEQIYALSYDETWRYGDAVLELFKEWNQRRIVSEDEKKI